MHDNDQVEPEHDQRPDAGQARKGRLKSILWTVLWACIMFYSGFSTRGSIDARDIRKQQDITTECIGVLKGFIIGRHSYNVRDKDVDKGRTLI